jgi:hypothetical protein
MPRPAMRMTASRKDGEEITFLDYRGESVTKRSMPVGVFWNSRKGNGFSFVPESGHVYDPETYWYNVYVEDSGEQPRRPAPKRRKESEKQEDPGEIKF